MELISVAKLSLLLYIVYCRYIDIAIWAALATIQCFQLSLATLWFLILLNVFSYKTVIVEAFVLKLRENVGIHHTSFCLLTLNEVL